MPSTVNIGALIETADGQQGEGLGSGFVVAPGIIATNRHVVEDAVLLQVQTSDMNPDGTPREQLVYSAQTVYVSKLHDVAFVRINPEEHPDVSLEPLVAGNSDNLHIGHPVMAFGAPLGLTGTISEGVISRSKPVVLDEDSGEMALETSANVRPGNSGGPVMDMAGQDGNVPVVGMAVAQAQGESGIAFIIPINTVMEEFAIFTQQETASIPQPVPVFPYAQAA